MFNSEPVRRSVLVAAYLLFSAVLLAPASDAWASFIINNYPDSQAGYTLSGSITFGYDADGNFIMEAADIRVTGPYFTTHPTLDGDFNLLAHEDYQDLTVTSQGLLATAGGIRCDRFVQRTPRHGHRGFAHRILQHSVAPLDWIHGEIGTWTYLWDVEGTGTPGSELYGTSKAIGGATDAGPWAIAVAVPEPGTLTLLVSALLGLGAFCLRRRRAKG